MKKWLCVILCCCFVLALATACDSENGGSGSGDASDPTPNVHVTPAPPALPPPTYVMDFADGNIGFLKLDTGSPGTDPAASIELTTSDGAEASLKMTAPNGGALRLGINVDGLLEDRVTEVNLIVIEVYAEYPDGSFSAVSGNISAMSGDLSPFATNNWQVYLESRNPNQAILQLSGDEGFSAEGPNLVEFSVTSNGPAERGETPAVIQIKSIGFYNSSNEALQVNTGAGFAAPAGFGDIVILGGWELPYPPPLGNPGGWQTWLTPGTDDDPSDYMPWEVLAASYGIVFVMDEPDSFEFVFFGKYNDWSWTQVIVVDNWANGMLTIMWEDIGFDPRLIVDGEETTQAKIAMGNWGETPVTSVTLLYDEDAVSIGD